MLLTMADTSCGGLLAGHAGMSVYGPPGLTTLVNAFRTFVNVRDIGLKVTEFGGAPQGDTQPAPVVQSELVTITPVTLAAEGAGARADAAQGGAGADEPQAKRQRLEGGDAAAAAAAGQAAAQPHDVVASVSVESPAACYVCELPDVPGKFLPQKVRPGVPGRALGWPCAAVAGRWRPRACSPCRAALATLPTPPAAFPALPPSPPPPRRPRPWACRAAPCTASWCGARR